MLRDKGGNCYVLASVDEPNIEIVNHSDKEKERKVDLGTDPDGCDGEGDRWDCGGGGAIATESWVERQRG